MCTALKMFNPGAASANARETAISWSTLELSPMQIDFGAWSHF